MTHEADKEDDENDDKVQWNIVNSRSMPMHPSIFTMLESRDKDDKEKVVRNYIELRPSPGSRIRDDISIYSDQAESCLSRFVKQAKA